MGQHLPLQQLTYAIRQPSGCLHIEIPLAPQFPSAAETEPTLSAYSLPILAEAKWILQRSAVLRAMVPLELATTAAMLRTKLPSAHGRMRWFASTATSQATRASNVRPSRLRRSATNVADPDTSRAIARARAPEAKALNATSVARKAISHATALLVVDTPVAEVVAAMVAEAAVDLATAVRAGPIFNVTAVEGTVT